MRLFHGSDKEVKKPLYKYGKIYNDYGQGFYLTRSKELAKEWASDSDKDGYLNEYDIDLKGMNVLDLTSDNYNVLHWLAILVQNRKFSISSSIMEEAKTYLLNNFLIDTSNYDVIIGYRADDSYFSFAKDFLSNTISIQKLSSAMNLGNLGIQVFIKSQKAFDHIKFIKSEIVSSKDYYCKKIDRDLKAREKYSQIKDDIRDGLYMIDILKGGIKDDDKRLYQ